MRLFISLLRSPRGRDLDALADEMSISRKTADRYARVLLNEVPGQDGLPLVELVRPGGKPRLRLRSGLDDMHSSEFQAASMFLAAAALLKKYQEEAPDKVAMVRAALEGLGVKVEV